MRRLALIAPLVLCACQPDRAGIEDVFLEQEGAIAPVGYERARDEAHRTLRRQGPEAALPVFMRAYRLEGAGEHSWELLPTIARLELARHQPAMARRMAVSARLSHRLSLGEIACAHPEQGGFLSAEDGGRPFGEADVGSAALVAMSMCRTPRQDYFKRPRNDGDALFERQLQAVEALLPPGASGSAPKTP